MNLLVTGGCGFIGSNFIRQRLMAGDAVVRQLVNLDKLTYAGNLANLSDFEGAPATFWCKAISRTGIWWRTCWSNIKLPQ